MPGTNGLELARRIAGLAPGVPVIVVSGRRVELRPDGPGNVRKVVAKPYDKAVISAAIREVLDGGIGGVGGTGGAEAARAEGTGGPEIQPAPALH
jgi:DNA-binding NarL/FixJ family response regulator